MSMRDERTGSARRARRRRVGLGIAAMGLAAPAIAAAPAFGAYPGHNGMLAFSSTENGARHIFVQRSSGPVDLTGARSSADEVDPRFSPDGREILFTRYARGLPNTEIFVMAADGRDRVALTDTGQGNSDATWSPDGRQIAFVSDRNGAGNIFVMNTDGTGLRQITHDGAGKSELAWSPRGDRIAFVREPAGGGDREIYSIRPDGSGLTDLSRDPTFDDVNPAFSPDGGTIVYSGPFHPGGASEGADLWLMSAAGGDVRPLDHGSGGYSDGGYPAWSPDGSTIAFSANNGTGYAHVWTTPAGGGDNAEAVTNNVGGNPVDQEVDWQPLPGSRAPVTRITRVHASARSLTVRFTASGPATSYRCTLTAGRARTRVTACHSPMTFGHLGHRRYTISVTARAPGEPYRAATKRVVG